MKSPVSPIQVVEIGDEDTSHSKSTESDKVEGEAQKEEETPSSSRILIKDSKNPFSVGNMVKTPVKKKMFIIESLGAASKIIGTESWLEDTLERKRKRKDESVPSRDIVSQAIRSGAAMIKTKK